MGTLPTKRDKHSMPVDLSVAGEDDRVDIIHRLIVSATL